MRPEGINAADTAWLLVAAALVLLMTPALALFYGGMVRRQNVLSTFMYVLAPLPIVSIEWAFGGYGLVFGPSVGGLIGSPSGVDFTALATAARGGVPALAFAAYQMMFAVITPALVSGAFVERMKFSSYLAFVALWSPLVYAPVAHWVWGEGGWLASLGALDFAGGTVVHASAGVSALVGAFVLGPRSGYPRQRHVPHNLTMTLTGAGLLWFGWFGFNAGSALSSGALAALAFMTTHLGAASGALAWVAVEWAHRSKPTALGLASGLVAGLVAITPAAGFVSPASAVVVGAAGAAVCYAALALKERLGYDDSLDAFGIHGAGGVAGALLTGVFADRALNPAGADGLLHGGAGLVARQALGVLACSAYAAVVTFLLLRGLGARLGLRATPADESEGLDVAHHGEQGYTFLARRPGGLGAAAPGSPGRRAITIRRSGGACGGFAVAGRFVGQSGVRSGSPPWRRARAGAGVEPKGNEPMDTKAAVAYEAGKPLVVETIQIEGPREGEVLVEIKATGVCHTDAFTLSGQDPEGLFPAVLGHEGAGVVVDVGPGVRSVKKGDRVIPLYTPECRQCKFCLSQKTNLCQAIRATQGKGLMPDGSSRFSARGKQVLHYMGTSTFANHTVLPEIAVAKIRDDAPFDKVCLIGCGVTTGVGAVINTAGVEPGANVVVFGLGGIGLNVVQGARIAGADKIVGVDLNPARKELAERLGMTHFVNPNEVRGDLVPYLVDLTGGGADYSFECIGSVEVMRQALECCHKGWGVSVIIGVAGAGQEIKTRPFQLVTGRVWKGSAFGGARGRTDVPKIVDWYMDKKIVIDELVTHTMPLEKINDAFHLMHEGKSIRSVVTFS